MVILKEKPFLAPTDFDNEVIITFINEGRYETFKDGDKERENFVIGVKLAEDLERDWVLNSTSQIAIQKELGNDTAKWVGVKVVLCKKEQIVFGKEKSVMYFKQIVGKPMKEPEPEEVLIL